MTHGKSVWLTCVLFQVLPVNAKRKDGKNDVFYNPAQVHMVFGRHQKANVLVKLGWFWCLTL